MKIRLPRDGGPERVYSEIEKGFDKVNEYALPRAGGVAGQVLTKASARDFDFVWSGTGSSSLPLELRSGWLPYGSGWRNPTVSMSADGIVTVNAIIRDGTLTQGDIAQVPLSMCPSGFVGPFVGLNNDSVRTFHIGPDGIIAVRGVALTAGWVSLCFSYKAG